MVHAHLPHPSFPNLVAPGSVAACHRSHSRISMMRLSLAPRAGAAVATLIRCGAPRMGPAGLHCWLILHLGAVYLGRA